MCSNAAKPSGFDLPKHALIVCNRFHSRYQRLGPTLPRHSVDRVDLQLCHFVVCPP